MSEESFVAERVSQLRAIAQRRNALLREFYMMLQHKQDAGSVLNVIDNEDHGMVSFLHEMDMEANPENGRIDKLLEAVSFDYPSPVEEEPHSPSPSPTNTTPQDLLLPDSAEVDPPPTSSPQSRMSQVSEPHEQSVERTIAEVQDDTSSSPARHTTNSPHSLSPLDTKPHGSPGLPPPQPPPINNDTLIPMRLFPPESQLEVTNTTADAKLSEIGESNVVMGEPDQSTTSDQRPLDIPPRADSSSSMIYASPEVPPTSSYQNLDSYQSIPPLATLIHPSPSILIPPSTQTPIFIPLPRSRQSDPTFSFEVSLQTTASVSSTQPSPFQQHYNQFDPKYSIPALKSLPVEFNRKGKLKQQRKREKERGGNDSKKEKDKDDWYPMGLNRWAALIGANPVWNKVARATKCLSSREWAVAMNELRLINTVKHVERLKQEGKWSFRQPKKQRGVGGLAKTHWDHLMDEVKWMRTDFREERKWKLALAYNLSTAVLEWHACKTHAERIKYGICVQWRKPSPVDPMVTEEMPSPPEVPEEPADSMDVDDPLPAIPDQRDPPSVSLLGLDYGSDDDEDEEEIVRQSVDDPLDPANAIADALSTTVHNDVTENESQDLMPKKEDLEDFIALRNDVDMDKPTLEGAAPPPSAADNPDSTGLRTTSNNPLLSVKADGQTRSSGEGDNVSAAKGLRYPAYASVREQIAHSDDLFLNLEDILAALPNLPTDQSPAGSIFPAPDLSSIFPDLQPYALLDPTPSQNEGKKRSDRRSDRDDPTKRIEDVTYTRLYPVGKFMSTKPTLLSALNPSKNWKDGEWTPLEEPPVTPDADAAPKISEEISNELFDGKGLVPPSSVISQQMQNLLRDNRRWGQDHPWTPAEDALLKQFIDKYPYNWPLISECFNASRTTVPTDRRTSLDCMERWKEKWAPDIRLKASENQTNADAPQAAGQMTTRGIKRLGATSASSASTSYSAGGEPRKRRRHQLLQDAIRKGIRKRTDTAQKAAANARKAPAIHETHNQFNKMPKLTPADLSRTKAEKEARDAVDLQNARRRQEELARQTMLRNAERLAQQNGQAPPIPAQQLPAQSPTTPQQQQQAGATPMQQPVTPVQRVAAPVVTPMAQLRSPQVNISQQQRIAAATTLTGGATRLSPPQMTHNQVRLPNTGQSLPTTSQAQAATSFAGAGPGSATAISQGFSARDSTSSPNHLSPPQPSATPATVNSPRPPSAQSVLMQAAQVAQVPVNAVSRAAANVNGHYYLPNVPPITQEQLQSALRIQMLQHQAQAQQLQQVQQAQQQAQQGQQMNANGTFGGAP